MPTFWPAMLLIPLIVIVIPVAILIAQRWRGGPLISLSGGALLSALVWVALLWESQWSNDAGVFGNPIADLTLAGAVLLMLGAWTLTLTDALRVQRWSWAGTACLAVYGTFVGVMGLVLSPYRVCVSSPPFGPQVCMPLDWGQFALFTALILAGPAILLAYAVRAQGRPAPAAAALLEGLTVSRLDARAE